MKFTMPTDPPSINGHNFWNWKHRTFEYCNEVYIVTLIPPICHLYLGRAREQPLAEPTALTDEIFQAIKIWHNSKYDGPVAEFLQKVLGS